MPARMTPTAWKRGATNALICGLIFLVCWLLVAELISSVSHLTFRTSAGYFLRISVGPDVGVGGCR